MDLFSECTYKKESVKRNIDKPPVEKKFDDAEIQAKVLERQMNEWLKQKHGMNFERVSIDHNKTIEVYNHDSKDNFVDNELQSFMKKRKWNSLPKSSKWYLVKEYCKKNNDEENLEIYKARIESNNLKSVVYDNVTGEIVSITL
jgi:hypothetical protein